MKTRDVAYRAYPIALAVAAASWVYLWVTKEKVTK